ncbi:unnamed protein product [Lupinus luteus]|uniref:Uncharacterized protein n=1 Tax=Lupinus luteus TaxID=3873 RepID=A0AAV1VXF3_LUPLU
MPVLPVFHYCPFCDAAVLHYPVDRMSGLANNPNWITVETWANGESYEQSAIVEVLMLVCQIRYYAGWASRLHVLTILVDESLHMQTLHEPIGTSLFSYLLGRLDRHGHVTPLP